MPPINKPLHRLKCLLETCAQRDPRYKAAAEKSARIVGPTPGEFSKLLDLSQMPDAELFHETHNHLRSMLVCSLAGSSRDFDLHHHLQTIERIMPALHL